MKIENNAGFLAAYWCTKWHFVHCLKGEFVSEMQGGIEFRLNESES